MNPMPSVWIESNTPRQLPPETEKHIRIPVGQTLLAGNLTLPVRANSVVIFSHGSGSSRFSPRNNFVAQHLQKNKIGTLLVDLLTPEEDSVYANRFNIDLLTDRLLSITKWVATLADLKGMPIGYFGASTGAASALRAAARLPQRIGAIVSRGGRPDLAQHKLGQVKAATLLIVGELDTDVLRLNQQAFEALHCMKELRVIANATHLFEEPGALEEVAQLAGTWFTTFLSPADRGMVQSPE